jgi:hypothetical protein
MVYRDILPEKPLRYPSSALGFGIIALGKLDLPEIANSGPNEIPSALVVYFRDSYPIVYSMGPGQNVLLSSNASKSFLAQPPCFYSEPMSEPTRI